MRVCVCVSGKQQREGVYILKKSDVDRERREEKKE